MALLSTDPVVWALDPVTNQLLIPIRFLRGAAAIVQGARTRLRMIKGEFFANTEIGFPYFERPGVPASEAILGQHYDEEKLRRAVRDVLLDTPGISSITQIVCTFNSTTRKASVFWEATATFGDTVSDSLLLEAS